MTRPALRRVAVALAWVAILLVGGALRLVGLDRAPAGLWYDEGLAGLNARRVLAGERPLFFFGDGYPEEPLFFYLQAAMIRLHGAAKPEAWPLRATAALVGLLTLPAFYLFARRLMSPAWALGATALLAFFPWHVHFSRLGFRTILTPLMVSLTGWALLGWTRRGGARRAVAAAAFLGATLYTYTAANVMVPVVALFLGAAATLPGARRAVDGGRRYALGAALGVAVALAVFAPLGLYYLREHERVVSRLVSVGPSSAAWSPARNAGGLLLFWMASGDPVFKHGPVGRPVFLFPIAPVFLAGVVFAALQWRRRGGAWLFVLLSGAGFLAASYFSEHAPNKLRSLGAVPAVVLCFVAGLRLAVAALRGWGMPRWLVALALALGFALWALAEAKAVVYDWHGSQRLHPEFSGPFTEVARWARGDLPAGGAEVGGGGSGGGGSLPRDPRLPFYVPTTVADHATVRYLTADLPVVRPLRSLRAAIEEARAADRPALYLLATNLHPANAGRLEALGIDALPQHRIAWTTDGGAGVILALPVAGLPRAWSDEQAALLDGWFTAY